MVSRPYKCPLCHSTFRKESGMKWHIAHIHEIPTAFDVLSKDYDAKVTNLQEENALLKKEVKDLEMKLSQAEIDVMKEQAEKWELAAEVTRLNNEMQKLAMALVFQNSTTK